MSNILSNITSANSQFILTVSGLFNAIPIKGYSVDDAFSTADVRPAEVMMGVDGKLSGGYTPYPVPLHVTLQADSPSMDVFDQWLMSQQVSKVLLPASAIIVMPTLFTTFAFFKGYLTSAALMPASKKVLQPRSFEITFESMGTTGV